MSRTTARFGKWIVFMAFVLVCPKGVLADASIDVAINQLGKGLTALRASVSQLSDNNEALLSRNEKYKLLIRNLEISLKQKIEEHQLLRRSASQLKVEKPAWSKQIARLEKDVFEWNEKMDRWVEEGKADQTALDRFRVQDEELVQRWIQMGGNEMPQADAPLDSANKDFSKEKLRLLKMIFESKGRQAQIQQQMDDLGTSMTPDAPKVEDMFRRQDLLNQIQKTKVEIAQIKLKVPLSVKENFSDEALRSLDAQIRDLQKNHDDLQALIEEMKHKAERVGVSADERIEMNKLFYSLETLSLDGHTLRKDLDILRRQMVTLDKRKTLLNELLRQK